MIYETKIDDQIEDDTEMNSVFSVPNRCRLWGDSGYRGNCDGTLVKNLVLRYRPRRVADPMMGSGTTRDVVHSLNAKAKDRISIWGGDLREGFDLQASKVPGEYDLVFLHPPYWNMIRYSDDPRDLSTMDDYDDFLPALQRCLLNAYSSLAPRGRLAVLVGDLRRRGTYTPIVRDVLNMEGAIGQLRSIIIKTQHNCTSDRKHYAPLEDVRIAHEYCIIFKRP